MRFLRAVGVAKFRARVDPMISNSTAMIAALCIASQVFSRSRIATPTADGRKSPIEAIREQTLANQKKLGIVPANTELAADQPDRNAGHAAGPGGAAVPPRCSGACSRPHI